MILTSIQKKTLAKWNNDSRYAYNKTISIIQDENYTNFTLRNIIIPKHCNSRIPWFLETPKSIRENAVFEANKNKKACYTNLVNGNIKKFNIRFLSRKKKSWTIGGINSVKIKSLRCFEIFPDYDFGNIKTTEDIPKSDKEHQWSIHFDGLYYYALVPIDIVEEIDVNKNIACSIDPGERTFLNVYDPIDESNVSIGDDASKHIYKKLLNLDKLISKHDKEKNKKKQKMMKIKIMKIRKNIKNTQNELHNKCINYLTKSYKNIIIPKLGVSDMISKKNRVISSETVRKMTILGHCGFVDKLKAKTSQRNFNVEIQDEKRTTMACGNCFLLNRNIGTAKEWICSNCKWFNERDSTAARNILLKNIHSKIQPEQICFASWFSSQ